MDEFQTEIVNISEEALNELFDETPDNTVNANTLIGGKKAKASAQNQEEDEEEETEDESPKNKKKAVPKAEKQIEEDLEEIDLEDIEEEEPEDEEEEKPKSKKAQKKDAPSVEEEKEEHPEQNEGVKNVLKSTVDFLVEKGVWEDFENRDQMEIDQETYAQLVIEQDKRRIQGMFEELVDSTGPYGKAIIDYVKNGGNPDEIIDLFKEQKQIDSIDVETVDGQRELIKHYYTEVMGWKSEKAEKYISNLVLSNELESEAQEVKELFGKFYQKEAEKLNRERQEFAEKQRKAEEDFASNIRSTLKERKDLSITERKMVEDYLLNYDQRLPNGHMVNKFYVNFAKIQANPSDYVDLVLHVMDKQKFIQKIQKQEQSKATEKAFNFIKGNGAISNKKGSSYDQIKKNEKVSGFDWGLPKR
jgi:ribosomal protein S8